MTVIVLIILCLVVALFLNDVSSRVAAVSRRLDQVEKKIREGVPVPKPVVSEPAAVLKVEPLKEEIKPEEKIAVEIQERKDIVEEKPVLNEPLPVEPPKKEQKMPSGPEKVQAQKEDWEVTFGGNWLNKIGVTILIVGIALFLGYSLTYMGPSGRIATGLAVSGFLLGGGVFLEKKKGYAMYGRGLIGGGWAGVYFTTYAMHAVGASKIIFDPLLATALLLAVSAGMILHSLLYRSEIVTGLSYFLGFVTLAMSPSIAFSTVSLMFLVLSLLCIAKKLNWNSMALFGIMATYGIYVYKAGNAPVMVNLTIWEFIVNNSMLIIYWLFFEIFDLIDLARRTSRLEMANSIMPLNAAGFIGVMLLSWSASTPQNVSWIFLISAVGYMGSTICRAGLRPPGSFTEDASTFDRAAVGGYEGAVTLSVIMILPYIFQRFVGINQNIALLFVFEFLFLLGLYFRESYLRSFGLVLFIIPFLKLFVDYLSLKTVLVFGVLLRDCTPYAVLMALIFYLNRSVELFWGGVKKLEIEKVYSYAATVILVIVLESEMQIQYLALSFLLLALPLCEIGVYARLIDFRIQSMLTYILGIGTLFVINVFKYNVDTSSCVQSMVLAAIFSYAYSIRFFIAPPKKLPPDEIAVVRDFSSAIGSLVIVSLIWHKLPYSLIALGWGILGLMLFELGLFANLKSLRIQAVIVSLLTFCRLMLANFSLSGEIGIVSIRFATIVPLILLFYYYSFKHKALRNNIKSEDFGVNDYYFRWFYTLLATILLSALLYYELPNRFLTVALGVEGVALLVFGFPLRDRILRLSGLGILTFCIFKVFLFDLSGLDTIYRIISFIVLGVLLLSVSWIYTQFNKQIKAYLMEE